METLGVISLFNQGIPRQAGILIGGGQLGGKPGVDQLVVSVVQRLAEGAFKVIFAHSGGLGQLLVLQRVVKELLGSHVHAVQVVGFA